MVALMDHTASAGFTARCDIGRGGHWGEQFAQRTHGVTGLLQLHLHLFEMSGDDVGAGPGVFGAQ